LIDPPNIALEPIKNSDIANLTAGTAVTASGKNINLTVNCAANALSANATFVPQFSPTKSAILTGSSHVALNDGTDNGVGFKLFDPSGSAIAFKTPLSAFPQSLFTFTPTQRTLTKAYTIKYAKTSTAVKAGPVTSSITITFSIL
jgi:type 1 fimbria pilin